MPQDIKTMQINQQVKKRANKTPLKAS